MERKCFIINFRNIRSKNWETYRRQRNYVTKLKSKSINTYVIERCAGGFKDF